MSARLSIPIPAAAALALLAATLVAAPALAGDDALVLRVEDAEARPGGRLAVVLRTYEPRPLGQGQVCMRMRALQDGGGGGGGEGGPLLALEEVRVFGTAGDVRWNESFTAGTQTAVFDFRSIEATVNASDGPVAVLFFRTATDAPVDQTYSFEIDPADTVLFDQDGQPVAVAPRAGEVTFLPPGAPVTLEAEGDAAAAGSVLVGGVSSAESLPLAAGEVAVWYQPAILGAEPAVLVDPRYGAADLSVDTATEGLLRIAFTSPDHSLNEVPGTFLTILWPLAADAPLGIHPLVIDPDLSYLQAPGGAPVALAFEDDAIEVLAGGVLFADGFESGDLGAWSAAVVP